MTSTVLFFVLSAHDTSAKPVWEWTLDERIAVRMDAAARAARWEAARAAGEVPAGVETDDIVLGSRNPELLMPSELMDRVSLAFFGEHAKQEQWRKTWAAGAEILGPDFWGRLESVAGPYFDSHRRLAELARRVPVATDLEQRLLQEDQQVAFQSQCRLRAEALAAARAAFGPERFDRFLYGLVAPGVKVFMSMSEPFGPAGSHWRWMEEGC